MWGLVLLVLYAQQSVTAAEDYRQTDGARGRVLYGFGDKGVLNGFWRQYGFGLRQTACFSSTSLYLPLMHSEVLSVQLSVYTDTLL